MRLKREPIHLRGPPLLGKLEALDILYAPSDPAPQRLKYLPGYRRLLAISACTASAQQMQATAVGWYLYERTGSVLALGWIGLAQFLPAVLLFIPAGELADRFNRTRLMAASVLMLALGSAGLAFAAAAQAAPLAIYACLILTSAAQVISRPARDAVLPRVVPAELLGQAVATNSSVYQAASIIGPAFAGLVIGATSSALPVFGANLVLALSALVITLRLAVVDRPNLKAPVTLHGLAAGLEHVWRTKVILGAMTLDLFAVLFGGATALLPVYAKDILGVGAIGLGWLNAAPAVGAVGMALFLARRPLRERAGPVLLGAVAGFGAATLVFGLSRHYILSFAALVTLGALDNINVVVRQTIVQLWTPDGLRGRVSAVNRVFISSSNELGALESGAVAALIGPVATVVAGGIATIAVAVAACWLFPELRRLRSLQRA